MKYLKKFETHNKSNIYYEILSENDAMWGKKCISITDKAKNLIDKIIDDNRSETYKIITKEINLDTFLYSDPNNNLNIKIYEITLMNKEIFKHSHQLLSITECEDEWFIVRFINFNNGDDISYKCDQLEGMIECIKDII